ncbi:MAG: copper chaperone PCu(A)C [Anaerolineae bacterium]|nr:copper chaperone PCu(A)C [Anaerolineae bacterium]
MIKHAKFLVIALFMLSIMSLGWVAAHGDEGLFVRIAHLSPTAPAVDIYVNGAKAVESLAYKSVSAYMPVAETMLSVMVVPAGGTMDQAVTPEPIMLMLPADAKGYYTVAAVGLLDDQTFELFVLPQDGMAMPMEMAASAATGEAESGNIRISGAWARPTAAMSMDKMATPQAGMGDMNMSGEVTGAYMLIENTGSTADRLISAASDVSDMVQIHETTVESGMARMQEIVGGLEIPTGGKVELMPGGLHIMIMNVNRTLSPGDTISLTLTFESGTVIIVAVPIKMMMQ